MQRGTFDLDGIRNLARAEWLARRHQSQREGRKPPDDGTLVLVTNESSGAAEMEIRGYVSWPMVEALDKILEEGVPDTLLVRINSGGGSAYTGLEIANRLRGLESHVVTRNESAAMSAAAIIFLAGDERELGSLGTSTMFHGARGWIDILSYGPVEELEKVDVQKIKDKEIALLRSLDTQLVKMLTTIADLTEAKAKEIMDAEQQLTNEEALELGIATGTFEKSAKSAKPEEAKIETASAPEQSQPAEPKPEPEMEQEREAEIATQPALETETETETALESESETVPATAVASATEPDQEAQTETEEASVAGGGSVYMALYNSEEALHHAAQSHYG